MLGIPETRLAAEPEVQADLEGAADDQRGLAEIAARYPSSSLVWAALADAAHRERNTIGAYAYARVGYHRGLDALRKAGWRGQGPVPWAHEPNRGVLRSFFALRRAAAEIGEDAEVERLTALLDDADPRAAAEIEAGIRD
nr:DUF3151 domain-containing protein [Pseudoclavibacter chungangensis]